MFSTLASRVRRPSLMSKVVKDPTTLLPLFEDGMYMGWSGFTGVGYPKIIPIMLAEHVEQNNLQGKLKFNLFVGASSGADTEDRWAKNNMIDRRYPHQVGKNIQAGINQGRIRFGDKHLNTKDKPKSHNLDVVIIEATEITEEGFIVPGASVGATCELIQMADKIIIEVNTKLPSFKGLHDMNFYHRGANRKPNLITRVDDRVGMTSIPVDPEKIVAIVESTRSDATTPSEPMDESAALISGHILEFFAQEVKQGRMPASLPPLQSGIGNIANAIIGGLARGPFSNVRVWTEVIQDTFLDFFDEGKLDIASATSIRFSPECFDRFYARWNDYKDKIILRPQTISNAAELINRLGVVAMNTPVEFDIYGHANSTCVMGSRMLNGLGGSGDFLRNSKYSIMHTPSTRPTKTDPHGISTIVPMCTHVDHTEHDLDVFVTEQGLADLRGLTPRDRAREIIDKCAHPLYKPILTEYLELSTKACMKDNMMHEPHMLRHAFDMHLNIKDKGTMRIEDWNVSK
ncbi:acetyl-CoA hydrolase [Acrasis kona]|uniref:Acetyl-CoA hydrolase n=1 Tax=Acrasis kona TaxID=1008807 RepID=A0AAW2ZBN0_9EUKA